VHVCRRWRQIVFESPHRLDLKIRCTSKTPVKENLSIWPAFPIAIDFRSSSPDSFLGDAIAVLEHTDRVGYLKLDLTGLQLETLAAMTLEPFPVLKHLIIHLKNEHYAPLLPDNFLGGSALRPLPLQRIELRNIAFPALPTFLLSAIDLVELRLCRIPSAGYPLPVAMAMCLATFPRLKSLFIQFQYTLLSPDETHPPPDTRNVLPALTNLQFTGPTNYMEDFVAHIDCPRLNQISIYCLIHAAIFQVVQLSGFLNRSASLCKYAKVRFHSDARSITFDLYRPINRTPGWDDLHPTIAISCQWCDWHIFRTLHKFSAILSTVVDLKLVGKFWNICDLRDEYYLEWLHFLHQFSVLKALYVSVPLAEGIGYVMQSVKREVVAEALPRLDLICLEGQTSSIDKFVAVRRLSGYPLIVVGTEVEFDRQFQTL
jgi:hypothetical protein